MCGIVGYIGERQAQPVLLNSLKRLEYRGYDSAGMCTLLERKKALSVRKVAGKVGNLEQLLRARPLSGCLGIGHSRWATHGRPNQANAHPHLDCKGEIAIVHNGIIENYAKLKQELIKDGHRFRSQTDTEVIVHLIEKYRKNFSLEDAVKKVIKKLRGSFAICVLSQKEPDKLIGVRRGSPLIVGLGEGENFLASDTAALLNYTKEVIFLGEDELVVLGKNSLRIIDSEGRIVKRDPTHIDWNIAEAQKRGYAHFMLKEIYEQPRVSRQILSSRIDRDGKVYFQELGLKDNDLKAVKQIIIIACGTAYHAGLVGKYMLEKLAKVPVEVALSSEFRYRDPVLDKDSLIIAISQSGETADTLAAVKTSKDKGAKVLCICNVVGSSLTRDSDSTIYTLAGPEIGVASTKAYTAQVLSLYLFALYLANIRGSMALGKIKESISSLRKIPGQQEGILQATKHIKSIARRHSHFGSFLFLGRNVNYPSALEGALKLKEISYIPAEGYAAGEMKHGPIALIDEYRAVVCIAVHSSIYEKMISNIQEIRSRRGRIIIIASDQDYEIRNFSKEIIYIPKADEFLSPLLVALPLQLMAYYIACRRGCDVDQPRNLAKSVTVE